MLKAFAVTVAITLGFPLAAVAEMTAREAIQSKSKPVVQGYIDLPPAFRAID